MGHDDPASSSGRPRSHAPDVPALVLDGVSLVRGGRAIVDDVSWTVGAGEHWVVLGRNGSGKSSLLRMASLYQHPSSGTVDVLGERLGRTDVRSLRRRIGVASAGMAEQFRGDLTPVEIVMTAKNAALEPWWHRYDDADRDRARECLHRMEIGHLGERAFSTLSSGERQRVLLARTLLPEPGLLLLDEPTAGLDLAGREELLHGLALLAEPHGPAIVLVTHHVEEIPDGFDRVLMVSDGSVTASGPIDEVLDARRLSACFGLSLSLERRHGRWWAWGNDR